MPLLGSSTPAPSTLHERSREVRRQAARLAALGLDSSVLVNKRTLMTCLDLISSELVRGQSLPFTRCVYPSESTRR